MVDKRNVQDGTDAGNPEEKPVTPGRILFEEFMEPLGLSQNGLARAINVPPRRINEIVHGKRAITADTALRLAAYLGPDPQFWLSLQLHYDLSIAYIDNSDVFESITPHGGQPKAIRLNPLEEQA